jgi:hypothetical protein
MITTDTKMLLPRGDATNGSPLVLDMKQIYESERRLEDVKSVTPDTASEVMGEMNIAANDASRYLAWIQYELLMAKKNYDKRKAVLILEKLPDFLKEKGLKPNEDIRESFLALDNEAYQLRDRIDCLTAAFYMIEGKLKTFVRAFNAAKSVGDNRRYNAVAPITSPGANPWAKLEQEVYSRSMEDDGHE